MLCLQNLIQERQRCVEQTALPGCLLRSECHGSDRGFSGSDFVRVDAQATGQFGVDTTVRDGRQGDVNRQGDMGRIPKIKGVFVESCG